MKARRERLREAARGSETARGRGFGHGGRTTARHASIWHSGGPSASKATSGGTARCATNSCWMDVKRHAATMAVQLASWASGVASSMCTSCSTVLARSSGSASSSCVSVCVSSRQASICPSVSPCWPKKRSKEVACATVMDWHHGGLG